MTREERINCKYGYNFANDQTPVYDSKDGETVVKFIRNKELSGVVVDLINNNDLLGIYYDDEGNLIAHDKSYNEFQNILH